MKNLYKIFAIISVSLVFTSFVWAEKQSLVIMDFEANGIPPEEAKVFTEHLQVEIFNCENFVILEKPDISGNLAAKGFQTTICSSVPCLIEAGKLSNADLVLGGMISKISDTYSITARLIDIGSDDVVKIVVYDHEGDIVSLLSDGVEHITAKLLEPKKIVQEPTVVQTPDSTTEKEELSVTKPTASLNAGGIGPALASCLIGPRVGLEMNEGNDEIHLGEWIALGESIVGSSATGPLRPVGNLIVTGSRAYMAYEMGGKTNSLEGALASYCIGPRIGNEINYRKIRNKEWLLLIPCINIYPLISIPLEAYRGKTMTEIEIEEGLRK